MVFGFGKIGIGKVIAFLVSIIILIQIWHIGMLKKHERLTLPNNQKNEGEHGKIRLLISKIENAHVLDSSGSYNIITDIFRHEDSSSTLQNDVTLVSQTSSNNLDDVIALSERWDGAISISVFTHFTDFQFTMDKLLHLHVCFPKIQNRVHFHLVYPLDNDIPLDKLKQNFVNSNCEISMKTFHNQNYEIEGIEYPHNLLRNTAVKFCKTSYVFLIDIDMLPNKYLRKEFNMFVQSFKNDSVVFVVPSFESKDDAAIPIDRTQLLRNWRLKKIRPFYFDVCRKCQRPTDYDQWQYLPDPSHLNVAYFVQRDDAYEPFYIAKKDFPLYDERFKQYGYNRISQVCEMNIAGYNFGVLNNAFLIHKGFKYRDSFHKNKEIENNRNRDLFQQFKRELRTKYPNSKRSC